MAFKMKAGKEGPMYKNFGIGKKSPMNQGVKKDPDYYKRDNFMDVEASKKEREAKEAYGPEGQPATVKPKEGRDAYTTAIPQSQIGKKMKEKKSPMNQGLKKPYPPNATDEQKAAQDKHEREANKRMIEKREEARKNSKKNTKNNKFNKEDFRKKEDWKKPKMKSKSPMKQGLTEAQRRKHLSEDDENYPYMQVDGKNMNKAEWQQYQKNKDWRPEGYHLRQRAEGAPDERGNY